MRAIFKTSFESLFDGSGPDVLTADNNLRLEAMKGKLNTENNGKDALGQPIKVGDIVLWNIVAGRFHVGIVTKITNNACHFSVHLEKTGKDTTTYVAPYKVLVINLLVDKLIK